MKTWFKFFLTALLGCCAAVTPRAQETPVMTVEITQVASLSGGTPPGQVAFVDITNVGAYYTSPPTITVDNTGVGFTTTAVLRATINLAGSVSNVIIEDPGSGYTSAPRLIFSPPTSPPAGQLGVTADARAYVGTLFNKPFQNESFGPTGTSIAISALATGTFPAGGFTYEFFANGISIGTAVATPPAGTPVAIGWTPPRPGSYFLTVRANDGARDAFSLPVRYFATGTMITSPTPNTIVPIGSSVVIEATSTPEPLAGGSTNAFVQRMEFYSDGVLIGTDFTAPYSVIYTPTALPSPHTILAVAYDNNGNVVPELTGTDTLDLTMVPPIGTPPTVDISSPADGAVLAIPTGGTSIPIAVAAGSPTGLITKVELYIDGLLFGTATTFPYSFDWTPTVVGTYRMIALAYDDKSNVVASSIAPDSTEITIAAAPTVTIVSPLTGATVGVGSPTTLTAAATDSNVIGGGIERVQFFAGGTFLGESTSPASGNQYTFSWTPPAAGTVSITALAINNFGISTTSSAVEVEATSGGGGGGGVIGVPPTVAVTSPAGGTELAVNQPVLITATAADADGNIGSVEFRQNGQTIGTTSTYPYSITWTPGSLGGYSLVARAVDNDGNSVTSAAVAVTVVDPAPGLPTVEVTAPAAGSTVTVGPHTLRATATDAVAVTGVQFFVNGVAVGPLVTTFPFVTGWEPTTPGNYTITARAINAGGNQATSAPAIVTVSGGTPPTISIAADTSIAVNTLQNITATAQSPSGNIASVLFFVNGELLVTDTSFPYAATWTPSALGTYVLQARAADNVGNITDSAALNVTVAAGMSPTVSISNPASASSYAVDTPLNITATAADADGSIAQVQFFVNGQPQGDPDTAAPYSAPWLPSAAGTYSLTAQATDNSGNVTTSAAVSVTITANGVPSVSVISPATGSTASAGVDVSLTATAADVDGTVTSVRYFVNGNVVGQPASDAPYAVTWKPTATGTYTLFAEATDNSGNIANSAPVTVTVGANASPTVAVTAPGSGSVVRVGAGTTLTGNATDADGTIASVQFFINGVPFGTPITAFPYRTTWVSAAEGVHRITATAIDNAGAAATSAAVTVFATAASNAGDSVAIGSIVGPGEQGSFTAINVRGRSVTLIGTSTVNGVSKTYFFPSIPAGTNGNFGSVDEQGQQVISGTFSPTGAFGSMAGNTTFFSGTVVDYGAVATASPGYYSGNLTGRPGSLLAAIVGVDGSIAVYIVDGTFQTAGAHTLEANGAFSIATNSGALLTGRIDPLSGFLSGSLIGGPGGTFTAASSSGVSFSDGFLRNLSTRGQVGTGNEILIAGFVVGGTSPKQVLIRAIGPSLTQFGITNALGDPQLQIYDGQANPILGLGNNNWVNDPGLVNAMNLVGAFPLATGSLDAVVLATLAPGNYSAQVTGTNGTTGIGLVEIYDVDNVAPFSSQKVLNLSTRGRVGPGQAQFSAGFVVSGNTPKKVLIRAAGPGLGAIAPGLASSVLADPMINLVRLMPDGSHVGVRENDNWEVGNDVTLITEASASVGAFPFAAGSRDAVILINLPPGTYSAQVSGPGTTGGLALVEVYEVP